MSKLDLAKEDIAYMKMWLGVALAVGVSTAGWFISNVAAAAWPYSAAALIGLAVVSLLCYKLHNSI